MIRGTAQVWAEIKVGDARLRLFGHVRGKDSGYKGEAFWRWGWQAGGKEEEVRENSRI